MAHTPKAFSEHFDELSDLVIKFQFPAFACKCGFLFENGGGMGSEHKYKFFDLAIFFHLTFETVDHELAVEFAHGASNELIRVPEVSKC
jgi:hypothetical protein